jgi:hypothetical protein
LPQWQHGFQTSFGPVAGYFAKQSRSAEFQAQRILDLERRLAASKGDVFEPLIEAMGNRFSDWPP